MIVYVKEKPYLYMENSQVWVDENNKKVTDKDLFDLIKVEAESKNFKFNDADYLFLSDEKESSVDQYMDLDILSKPEVVEKSRKSGLSIKLGGKNVSR